MPSSLTRVHSCALEYSSHPPESVYGTGSLAYTGAFLGPPSCNTVQHKASPRNSITWLQSRKRPLHFAGAGILTCFPSPTPIGLGVGPDYPRDEKRCPGNLGFTAAGDFTRLIVTHVYILSSHQSTVGRPSASIQMTMLLYHARIPQDSDIQSFGIMLIANHFRRRVSR